MPPKLHQQSIASETFLFCSKNLFENVSLEKIQRYTSVKKSSIIPPKLHQQSIISETSLFCPKKLSENASLKKKFKDIHP